MGEALPAGRTVVLSVLRKGHCTLASGHITEHLPTQIPVPAEPDLSVTVWMPLSCASGHLPLIKVWLPPFY